jgi:O-glycosyl hydrolase
LLLGLVLLAWLAGDAGAQATRITVYPERRRQEFQGLGAGAILFEGHITSLAARSKDKRQEELYDDMFRRASTQYLQLMIRETHEPKNDRDPWTPAFDDKDFAYCRHTVAIAQAARKRRPDIQLYATLYTPPPWMKTNNAVSGGGKERATLKRGMELKFAAYIWGFLEHMARKDVAIQYLSIANEPDWPHEQPGCFFPPDRYALLFKTVADYLDKMSRKNPKVPKPKLVGPNTLSAPGAAKNYLPLLFRAAGKQLDVIASHDYDVRGDRWGTLRTLAGKRPVWMTEWCARSKDSSPGMINSAIENGQAMHEAFKGGANVWMAYDWVYPPRGSGESLIFVDWGKDYRLLKAYHLFRQWGEPLVPGMRVVEVGILGPGASLDGKPGIKPTAFLAADSKTLVVHVVNATDREAPIALRLTGKWATATTAARKRTSADEDVAELEALEKAAGNFADKLPAQSMVTYRFTSGGK